MKTKKMIALFAITIALAFNARAQINFQSVNLPPDLQIISASVTKKYHQPRSPIISEPQQEAMAEPLSKNQPYRLYEVTIKNNGSKVITRIEWRYVSKFADKAGSGESFGDYISKVNIKPGKIVKLKEEGSANEPGFIVEEAGSKRVVRAAKNEVIIRRVEYEDGTVWSAG